MEQRGVLCEADEFRLRRKECADYHDLGGEMTFCVFPWAVFLSSSSGGSPRARAARRLLTLLSGGGVRSFSWVNLGRIWRRGSESNRRIKVLQTFSRSV